MLVAISCSNQERIAAATAVATDGPFICPECEQSVSLRKGQVVAHHFAHLPPVTCSYGRGESDVHRRCKLALYEALRSHPSASNVALEHNLTTVRPDVFAYINGVPVAIEVQLSTLSPDTIAARTSEYARKGIAVLWLLQWKPELDFWRYSPRRFERWVHATYFGRAYFWKKDLTILPYHFDDHMLHVGSYTWRDEKGRLHATRPGPRRSKRFKTTTRGKPLHLVHDFAPRFRAPWESKTLSIPEARLYMDTKNFRDRDTHTS